MAAEASEEIDFKEVIRITSQSIQDIYKYIREKSSDYNDLGQKIKTVRKLAWNMNPKMADGLADELQGLLLEELKALPIQEMP